MRETITINRIIKCTFIGKEIAQQISAYSLTTETGEQFSELITKYCSGEQACKNEDCQFIVGLTGKNYTKPLNTILSILKA